MSTVNEAGSPGQSEAASGVCHQPLEFEFTIEVKIKFVPTQQMRDILNRMLWDLKTTQPDKNSVKPATAAAEPEPQQVEMEGTGGGPVSQPVPEIDDATFNQMPGLGSNYVKITGIPWPDIDPATDPQPLREIEKIKAEDYIRDPIAVTGFKNLSYAETRDKRLRIMYGSTRVNTTWADIHTICGCKFKQETKDAIKRLIGPGRAKNKYTAVSRFVKAVSIGAVSPYKPKIPTDDDPDAAFKSILSGVVDTHVGDEGGKLEGTLD